MYSAVAAVSMEHWLTIGTDWVKIVGAAAAFVIGLQQYRNGQKDKNRAEAWKRREFIAAQIKDFEDDPKIQLSMAMLDWSGRKLCFQSNDCDKPKVIEVNDPLLCAALLPHTTTGGFRPDEMIIRDCRILSKPT
jgi:hypothetical protein